MRHEYRDGVYYNPDAAIAHKMFAYPTSLRWLLDRAFWKGDSKRAMQVLLPGPTGEEGAFLGDLLLRYFTSRVKDLNLGPSRERAAKAFMLPLFTLVVGWGHLNGFRWYPPLASS